MTHEYHSDSIRGHGLPGQFAIIEPYFSAVKAPFGFPLDEAKCGVERAGTWYNKGGSLVVPAGRWRVEYAAELEVTRGSGGRLCFCYPLHDGQLGGE